MQTKKNLIASTDASYPGGVLFSWDYVKNWPHEEVATPAAYDWYWDGSKYIAYQLTFQTI